MKVLNYRIGFATNSSSSHSIVINKTNKPVKDVIIDDGDYGWGEFRLASKAEKRRYLATQLYINLKQTLPESMANLLLRGWIDTKETKLGGIDHQSMLTLPLNWEHNVVDQDFFTALCNFIFKPEVVIEGGNDNMIRRKAALAGKPWRDLSGIVDKSFKGNSLVCRHDEVNDYWTLFNRKNGTKVRVQFTTDKKKKIDCSSLPELVDLKITDFCTKMCPYCYQGSTPTGQHGKDIWSRIAILGELKVFEVAIGGGEPTMHPGFIDILKHCKESGVVPNFSTRNLDWINDRTKKEQIMSLIGGFAYSIDRGWEMDKFYAKCVDNGIPIEKTSVQCIVGNDNWDIKSVIQNAINYNMRVTLLGLKDSRRPGYPPITIDKSRERVKALVDVLKEIKKDHGGYLPKVIGIDTKLAGRMGKSLDELEIDPLSYESTEGRFSLYIDAVQKKLAPHSFGKEGSGYPFILDRYEKEPAGLENMIRTHFPFKPWQCNY
jgi:hypothetical protein